LHFQALRAKDYFVCEKSDGVRCKLLVEPGEDGGTYVVDSDFTFRRVKADGYHSELWKNGLTLLDGELVHRGPSAGGEAGTSTFLIFDVMVVNGKKVASLPFSKRLHAVGEQVVRPFKQWLCRIQNSLLTGDDLQLHQTARPSCGPGADMLLLQHVPLVLTGKRMWRKNGVSNVFNLIR
jgi:hypothetical protein